MNREGERLESRAADRYQRENQLLEQVWKRVAPAPAEEAADLFVPDQQQAPVPVQTAPAERQLTHFVSELYESAQTYQMMARRYRQFASVFSKCSVQERQNAKQISALLFLRTGRRLSPPQTSRVSLPPEVHTALRVQILAERKRTHTFWEAAKTAPDADLREAYQAMAETEKEHAETLQRLLVRIV